MINWLRVIRWVSRRLTNQQLNAFFIEHQARLEAATLQQWTEESGLSFEPDEVCSRVCPKPEGWSYLPEQEADAIEAQAYQRLMPTVVA